MNKQGLIPFLAFGGNAAEAMRYYESALPGAKIESIVYFEAGMPGEEGKVLNGVLAFKGVQIMFMDMPKEQAVPFSWATSLYVDCLTEADFDAVFAGLAEGGFVMMGPEPVMQFKKVAWVTDRFGVTWQPVWAG